MIKRDTEAIMNQNSWTCSSERQNLRKQKEKKEKRKKDRRKENFSVYIFHAVSKVWTTSHSILIIAARWQSVTIDSYAAIQGSCLVSQQADCVFHRAVLGIQIPLGGVQSAKTVFWPIKSNIFKNKHFSQSKVAGRHYFLHTVQCSLKQKIHLALVNIIITLYLVFNPKTNKKLRKHLVWPNCFAFDLIFLANIGQWGCRMDNTIQSMQWPDMQRQFTSGQCQAGGSFWIGWPASARKVWRDPLQARAAFREVHRSYTIIFYTVPFLPFWLSCGMSLESWHHALPNPASSP